LSYLEGRDAAPGGHRGAWERGGVASGGPRIAFFTPLVADDPESLSRVAAFVQGMQELGWMAGQIIWKRFQMPAIHTKPRAATPS
jgi:hypothetical protein